MTTHSNESGLSDPEVTPYPLQKPPTELLFGDVILLPADSGRESGAKLVLESWQRDEADKDRVHANGVLIRGDTAMVGGGETFSLPESLTVEGHCSIDELAEYYLANGAMATMGKTKIEELIRQTKEVFSVGLETD